MGVDAPGEVDRRDMSSRSRRTPRQRDELATGRNPGGGPINALTMTLTVDTRLFTSGRHLAGWIGLTPKERSTRGKRRPGAISKQGNERLRQLLDRRDRGDQSAQTQPPLRHEM